MYFTIEAKQGVNSQLTVQESVYYTGYISLIVENNWGDVMEATLSKMDATLLGNFLISIAKD